MSNHKILLIEDNSSDVALTRRAFEKNRIANDMVVVDDGQKALDHLWCTGPYAGRDASDLPAVVLLDLKLPKVNGLAVLKKIREDARTRRLPAVILTSSREQSDVGAGYDLGVNNHPPQSGWLDGLGRLKGGWVVGLGIARCVPYWIVQNWPPAPSAASCSRMYVRTCSSSNPTVDTA
jgi:CheY-like chemotaxis protein